MTRCNRVDPFGRRIAVAARGGMMGNRGDLHRPDGSISDRLAASTAWICCTLAERNGKRVIFDRKGHYTPLFFLDEATAFAAGHRPCAACRRADYRRFVAAWAEAHGGRPPRAAELDRQLSAARLTPEKSQRRFAAPLSALPVGTLFTEADAAFLVAPDGPGRWTPEGYRRVEPGAVHRSVEVLTPAPVVRVFSAGYRPQMTRFL